jgi:metal-responsive CopG/Arc/MetJ family transcriptional regulator
MKGKLARTSFRLEQELDDTITHIANTYYNGNKSEVARDAFELFIKYRSEKYGLTKVFVELSDQDVALYDELCELGYSKSLRTVIADALRNYYVSEVNRLYDAKMKSKELIAAFNRTVKQKPQSKVRESLAPD